MRVNHRARCILRSALPIDPRRLVLAAPALDRHIFHMAQISKNKLTGFLTVLLTWFSMAGWAAAAEVVTESLDQKIGLTK